MRIRCQKEAEDYKPVRGNEKEIINHLLEHDIIIATGMWKKMVM